MKNCKKIAKSEALIDYARKTKEKLAKHFDVDISKIVWMGLDRFLIVKEDGSQCIVFDNYGF